MTPLDLSAKGAGLEPASEAEIEGLWWMAAWPHLPKKTRAKLVQASRKRGP
jgi:hypothetical protein